MSRRQVCIASLVCGGALALTNCAGGGDIGPSAESVPSGPAPVESVTDAVTSTAFRDVLPIVGNVDVPVGEGRMEAQEQQGWYGLATRVLDRVPTRGECAVSDPIASLKESAPATAQGAVGTPGFWSTEWVRAEGELASACADAGAQTTVDGFTGG